MNPGELSEQLMRESATFGTLSDKLGEILQRKPGVWLRLRADTQSDSKAERMWENTDDGIDETVLRLKMKALLVSMSAIKNRLRTLSDESKNLY